MTENARTRRHGLMATVAAAALALGPPALAQGAGASPADELAALRAQVAQLQQIVQQVSQQDQSQIQALTAQVQNLQARLGAEEKTLAAVNTAPPPAGGIASVEAGRPANTGQALPRVVQNASHRFLLESANGQYSMGVTGGVQLDSGDYFDFHADNPAVGPQALSNGFNARRARIGVAGTAFGDWGYAFIYDAGNSQDTTQRGIQTAQIVYAGIKGVAIEGGYTSAFFTLDQSTSGYDTLFMERASPANIATSFNAGDFRSTAGVRFFGDRYWVGGYFTGPSSSSDSHTQTAERFGAFERATVQALSGPDYSLHLGVAFDQLLQAPNAGNGTPNELSLSDQPELRVDPTTFLNTGPIGTAKNPVRRGYVLDFESAATWRGFFWQGEYFLYQVDRLGLPSNNFRGEYGELGWTITGESRQYNPQAGAYFRIVPDHPFSLAGGGWGAWEVGARVSHVGLESNYIPTEALSTQPDAINGGTQTGYALDLNWYPNDFLRFILEFNRTDYDKLNGTAVKGAGLGAPVGANFNAIALRAQFNY